MNKKLNIKVMVIIAIFAAIIAVCSIISIPMPTGVAITLQTFAIALCGYCLKKRYSVISVLVYIALGTIGIPIFSGFKGGIQVLIGPTGGFIVGFIFMVLLAGFFKHPALKILAGLLGLAACHICGVIWFSILMEKTLVESFLLVSVPYLIKDTISVVLAYLLSIRISKLTLFK